MTKGLILIIEDNVTLAYGLRNNLEIEGHEVQIGEDGAKGLDLAGNVSAPGGGAGPLGSPPLCLRGF